MRLYDHRRNWWLNGQFIRADLPKEIPVIFEHRVDWTTRTFHEPGAARTKQDPRSIKLIAFAKQHGMIAVRFVKDNQVEFVGIFKLLDFAHGPRRGGSGDDWISGRLGETVWAAKTPKSDNHLSRYYGAVSFTL